MARLVALLSMRNIMICVVALMFLGIVSRMRGLRGGAGTDVAGGDGKGLAPVIIRIKREPPQIPGVNVDALEIVCPFNRTLSEPAIEVPRFSELRNVYLSIPEADSLTAAAEHKEQLVPRTVLMLGTVHGVSAGQFDNVAMWKKLNPEYTFKFYFPRSMRNALQSWEIRGAFQLSGLTDSLNGVGSGALDGGDVDSGADATPGADRSKATGILAEVFDALLHPLQKLQFFKYVFLYVHGGVFVDTSLIPVAPIDEIVTSVDTVVIAQGGNIGRREVGATILSGNFLASTANTEFLRRLIEGIIINVRARAKQPHPEQLTGDFALTTALARVLRVEPLKLLPGRAHRADVSILMRRKVVQAEANANCLLDVVVDGILQPMYVLGYLGQHIEDAWLWPVSIEKAWSTDTIFAPFKSDVDPARAIEQAARAARLNNNNGCPFGITPADDPESGIASVNASKRLLLFMPNTTRASKMPTKRLRIPRKILQTAKDASVPVGLYHAMHSTIAKNPDWTHHYFDDARAREYISEHMSEAHLQAFDSLVPGAYKSDLFRYIWLYHEGGVYVDADQIAQMTLTDFLEPQDEFVSAEDPGQLVYNAFMAATPRHPIIAEVLQDVFTAVSNREYGNEVLDLTGPGALARAFTKVMGEKPEANRRYTETVRLAQHDKSRGDCAIALVRHHEKILFYTRYPEYRREMKWYLKQEPYWELWRSQRVYALPLTDSSLPPPGVSSVDAVLWAQCPFHRTMKIDDDAAVPLVDPDRRFVLDVAKVVEANVSRSRATEKELASLKACSIPKVIMQHYRVSTVPKGMYDAIESVRTQNVEFQHVFFDDNAAREFIAKHMNKSFVDAWDAIIPDAFRSDLFRYVWLFVNGGVYVDFDMIGLRPLSMLFRASDLFVSAEEPGHAVYNAFIAATPRHPVIAEVLRDIVGLIARKDYSYDVLSLTGSGALARAFIEKVGEEPSANADYAKVGVRLLQHFKREGCAIGEVRWHGTFYFFSRYPAYKRDMKWFSAEQEPFRTLWRERRVYRLAAATKPPPPPPTTTTATAPAVVPLPSTNANSGTSAAATATVGHVLSGNVRGATQRPAITLPVAALAVGALATHDLATLPTSAALPLAAATLPGAAPAATDGLDLAAVAAAVAAGGTAATTAPPLAADADADGLHLPQQNETPDALQLHEQSQQPQQLDMMPDASNATEVVPQAGAAFQAAADDHGL